MPSQASSGDRKGDGQQAAGREYPEPLHQVGRCAVCQDPRSSSGSHPAWQECKRPTAAKITARGLKP
jgi:hypothetical protein